MKHRIHCAAATAAVLTLAAVTMAGCSDDSPAKEGTSTADTNDTSGGGDVATDAGQNDAGSTIADAGACQEDDDCLVIGISCQVGRCKQGQCAVEAAAAGTSCDDGKSCTNEDQCQTDGLCAGKLSCGKQPVCVEAICLDDGSCATKSSIGPCDDGNQCTVDDHCQFKKCLGEPSPAAVCDDKNDCTTDTCQPDSGCAHKNVAAGKLCGDGNACTVDDTCDNAGKCQPGVDLKCDDSNPCTLDKCDKVDGCNFPPITDGTTCDDGSKCSNNDACWLGKCKGELLPKAQPKSACEQLLCDPITTQITVAPAPDGTGCSDGKPCTIGDACAAGECKGKALQCSGSNTCQSWACNPNTGMCEGMPTSDGSKCNDANFCTTKDICVGGKCVGKNFQVSKACDDDNGCTNDGCAPISGCFHVPKEGKCDDGDPCTTGDVCALGTCGGGSKVCADTNPCTHDSCDAKTGACLHETFIGPCDDGDPCSEGEQCVDGKCSGKAVTCSDNNSCTTDLCDSKSGCSFIPKPGGSPCDDGCVCTSKDVCDAGKCKGQGQCNACNGDIDCLKYDDGNPCNGLFRCMAGGGECGADKVCAIDPKTVIQCGASGDECSASLCNPGTGKCATKFKPKGTPCKTGDKCLVDNTCEAKGGCKGTTKKCNDNNPCTTDSCNAKAGCIYAPKKDTTPCDDDNSCTKVTSCMAGTCTGANNCQCGKDADCTQYDDGNKCNGLVLCKAGVCVADKSTVVSCPAIKSQPCEVAACEPGTGKCIGKAAADDAKCDDEDACTLFETCKNGVCASSGKLDCADGDACTIDVCDKKFGCGNAPVANGGPCSDGNPCTTKDACKGGACAGKLVVCPNDNPCTINTCIAGKGGCAALVAPNAECDDGNPCTTGDACKDGACVSNPIDCDDKEGCTVDACDGKGGCKHVQVAGKDCDDGDQCSFGDHCDDAGKCIGKGQTCDDGNVCTVDKCINGGCAIVPIAGQPCDDGDKCTEKDACDGSGACKAVPVTCEDDNTCTVVVGPCTVKNGCALVPNDGVVCTDGDSCTTKDICSGGACQGVKKSCDDKNPCTLDECVADKGCVVKANPCNDGNDCTFDKCDPPNSSSAPNGTGKGCMHSALNGKKGCTDGTACSEGGTCIGDKCSAKLKVCDDKNACTKDGCDPEKGCVYLPDPSTHTQCDDEDACTSDLCDGKGKCVGTKKDCNDDNPCTQDSCHKLKGCLVADLANGVGCEDGDSCTKDTVCQGGFCSGGKVTCPLCPGGTDAECAVYDDNDLCNGAWKCIVDGKSGKAGKCQPFPDPVVCDGTGDTACSKNLCNSLTGKCAVKQLVNGSKCDDGVRCTVGDTCQGGTCTSGVMADCSSLIDDCNKADCIEDPASKAGYSCLQLPKMGTVTCDADSDGCTAADKCDNGKCVVGKPIDCDGVGGPCESAICASTGSTSFTCKTQPAKELSPCDDGQACSHGDYCKGGKCLPGLAAPNCNHLDSSCAKGICDPKANGGSGACLPKALNEGKSCDADDSGCTVKDHCVAGQCVPGALPDCSAKTSSCSLGACQGIGATFKCIGTPTHEAKPCEADKDGCTVGDHCASGECTPGKLMDCSKLNGNGGCLIGTCKSLGPAWGSCTSKSAKAGTPCDADGNGCTVADSCNKNGACQAGKSVNCLAFAGSCATGQCASTSSKTFKCSGAAKKDGVKCDADGDGCTVGDKCKDGECVAGPAPNCKAQAAGPCIDGSCKSKGSAQYLCLPKPKGDGDACDADKNGCTKGDACVGGSCAKGALVTCIEFQGLCASATCKSNSPNSNKCLVTAKESYPPLKPPQNCKPSVKPAKCPYGYICTALNIKLDEGSCTATKTVSCDDNQPCTEGDICAKGECTAGPQKSCNDNDDCTLDACMLGKCDHKPMVGCTKCIDEDWDATVMAKEGIVLPQGWVTSTTEPKYLAFISSEKNTWAGSKKALRIQWKGPGQDPKDSPRAQAWLTHRRLYLAEGAPATLSFRLLTDFSNESCTFDTLEVAVNNHVLWQRCDNSKQNDLVDGWERVSLDLSAWAGAAIDLEFRVQAGTTADAKGVIDMDSLALSGGCGPACLGVGFEDRRRFVVQGKPEAPRIPQPWKIEASAPGWAAWKVDPLKGHGGKASMVTKWSGAPPGGKTQTAAFTIPGVQPAAGDILHYAFQAPMVGDSSCNGDVMRVSIGGQVIDQRCNTQPTWQVHSIKLAAWAGKTVDLRFEALSASGKSAAAQFRIDDIAIAGKCSYTCFADNFDPAGFDLWATTSQDVANMRFELNKTQVFSKPNSAYGWHNEFAPSGKAATLIARDAKGGRFLVPVTGATFSYRANVFIDKSVCAGGAGSDAGPLAVSLQRPDEPFLEQDPNEDVDSESWTMGSHCDSTSGWKLMSGPVNPETHGLRLVPAIEFRRNPKIKKLKSYFDNLKFVCK